jgi:hypothetical protein
MTIGFTKKLLVLAISALVLALAAAPTGFAGEDDGPTANGERIGSVLNGSGGGGSSSNSSNGSSHGSKSHSATGGVLGVQTTHVAKRDRTLATGAAQTGFGGMANSPGGNLLFTLFIGLAGLAAIVGVRGLPSSLQRRFDR